MQKNATTTTTTTTTNPGDDGDDDKRPLGESSAGWENIGFEVPGAGALKKLWAFFVVKMNAWWYCSLTELLLLVLLGK